VGFRRNAAAFTMVEIAISLAIIGFALVAIIGVLPLGMNVQRDNREETIINQDATYLIDAIRSGARGLDDLTNAVLAITNYTTRYDANTNNPSPPIINGYTYTNSSPGTPYFPINNGFRIIGLMSTPKYVFGVREFYSNHVVAYVRALSGLAVEKFPQDNPDVRQGAFSYRVLVENLALPAPVDPATNSASRQLTHNLRELRLSFRWPLLAGGQPGNRGQTFRTMIGGRLVKIKDSDKDPDLYFFQPQDFVKEAP